MSKQGALVCLLLVTSLVTPGCSNPPSDAGSGGAGGVPSGGTGSGGTESGGESSSTGGSSSGSGGTSQGSGGLSTGGDAGAGGFGGIPTPSGECDVPHELEIVILGQWVEGEQPEPLGGEIQPGVYDLTAYQRYTTDLPDDIHLGFSTQYSMVVEFGADGAFRAIESDSNFAVSYVGELSANGSELTIVYSCPAIAADSMRPYTATASTVLFYDGLGFEYVLTRRQD